MVHFILFLILFALDQATKIIMHGGNVHTPVIKGFLSFRYSKNEGAAFSFLADKPWAQLFFIILTSVASVGFFIWYLCADKNKRTMRIGILLIMNGALGNLVDRIAFGYVRDFISFSFFPPIFNVADAVLCIGVGLLIIHFLFLDKDALFRKKNKAKTCADEQVTSIDDCANAQTLDAQEKRVQTNEDGTRAQASTGEKDNG